MSDPSPSPHLTGYRCGEIVMRTAVCTQWAARGPDQEPALVRRHRIPPARVNAAERRLHQLRRSPHPRCLPVRAVERDSDGVVVAVEAVAGRDLASIMARHGGLRPAALERLAHGLAQALTHLHEHGLIAGQIRPEQVMLDGAGHPILDVTVEGVGIEGPGGAPTDRALATREDVAAMASLVAGAALDDPASREPAFDSVLAELLDRASAEDSDAPALEEITQASANAIERRVALVRAGASGSQEELGALADLAAASVREHVLAAPTRERARSRWWRWRWQVAVVLGGVLVGIGGAAAVSGPRPPQAQPAVPALSVQAAFRLRDHALTNGDLTMLARAVVPGSPAWEHDADLIQEIDASGIRLVGLRTVARGTANRYWVQQMPHVRAEGPLVRQLPSGQARCLILTTDGSGRLEELSACTQGP